MNAFSNTSLYLAGHFAIYVLILRQLKSFGREGPIFLYHALSAAALLVFLITSSPAIVIVGCLSLHGIYSLTFLELWSLAEGGYSLTILRRAQAAAEGDALMRGLEQIGSVKKAGRIEALVRLGLVSRTGQTIKITKAGRASARGLELLKGLAGLKDIG